MHRVLVEEKRWISEERFLHALNYCMLLPGPEAQQLATYVGWLMHGTRGGLAAGTLFILPGFLAIMMFSVLYVTLGHHPFVSGIFLGLKAAVVALVIQAVFRVGRRALRKQACRGPSRCSLSSRLALLSIPFPFDHSRPRLSLVLSGRAPGDAELTVSSAHGASTIEDSVTLAHSMRSAVSNSWRRAGEGAG